MSPQFFFKKSSLIPLLIIHAGVFAGTGIGAPSKVEEWVFRNGMTTPIGVPQYACYRIPALVTLADGSVMAFAEGRQSSCSDSHTNIDIVSRKKPLNGTWGDIKIVASHGNKVTRNAAPVVDSTGTIHMLYNVNYDFNNPASDTSAISESNINADNKGPASQGKNDYRAAIFYVKSQDGGSTWSTAQDISSIVHPNAGKGTYAAGLWGWYAITPGHAIQLSNGKLYFPANHTESAYAMDPAGTRSYSHSITYDLSNQTFSLGATIGADTNETMAAQLDNGWIYQALRNNHRSIGKVNALSLSTDNGQSWMGGGQDYRPNDISNYWKNVGYDAALISPRVQASVLKFSSENDASGVSRLVFSNPGDPDSRLKGTLRVSYDEGKTWKTDLVYHTENSAYSDLAKLSSGNLGVLYEKSSPSLNVSGTNIPGISFIDLNLESATNSQDAFITPQFIGRIPAGNLSTANGVIPSQTYLDPGTGDFTVTAVFSVTQNSNTQATQMLARKGNLKSSNRGWALFIEDDKIKFRTNSDGTNNTRIGVYASIQNLFQNKNKKYAVTARFNRQSGAMALFLDGAPLATTTLYASSASNSIATSDALIMGGIDGASVLNGKVYTLRIYAEALKDETISRYATSDIKNYNYQPFFLQDFSNVWPAQP